MRDVPLATDRRDSARLFDRLGRWSGRHSFHIDIVFALLMGVTTMLSFWLIDTEGSQREPDVFGAALIVGLTIALAFRRRAPIAAFAGVVALTVPLWIADYPGDAGAFSVLAAYAATAHSGADRQRVWRIVGALVGVLTAIALMGVLSASEDLPLLAAFGIAATHVVAAGFGEFIYSRRRRVLDLEQRAIRAETERELLARQAVLDERTRIARDLHDVVAHNVSVMVVQAAAAQRTLAAHPDQAALALDNVQSTGRAALNEMRRMLGVLRRDDDSAELTPQPTLDDLDAIVQHCIDAGIPTDLTIEGELAARSAGAEMAAYRVVQEALTNVIKHAGRPVRAAVRVTFSDDRVRLEIDDDGKSSRTQDVDQSTGHGIVGMRERVELYHGSLRAGPRPGGGFRVAAEIPLLAEAQT